MTDQAALATALTSLANAVNNIGAPGQVRSVFLDPFTGGHPSSLSTRSGSAAYELLSKPLDKLWDSAVGTLPAFIVVLRLRTGKGKWNAMTGKPTLPIASNIITITGHNILTNYHSVIDAKVNTASASCNDNRAIQNSSVFSNASSLLSLPISKPLSSLRQAIYLRTKTASKCSNYSRASPPLPPSNSS